MASDPAARLDGWKAIADYLGRDVRTAQRWRDERGMPTHRVPGQRGGAVFAERDELNRWLFQDQTAAAPFRGPDTRMPAGNATPPAHSGVQLASERAHPLRMAARPLSPGAIAVSVVAIGTIIFGGARIIRAIARAR